MPLPVFQHHFRKKKNQTESICNKAQLIGRYFIFFLPEFNKSLDLPLKLNSVQ